MANERAVADHLRTTRSTQEWLGDSPPPYCVIDRSPEASLIRRRIKWLENELNDARAMLHELNRWAGYIRPAPTKEETPVDKLELSVRTGAVLSGLGCKTLSDVSQLKRSDLLRTPNCGRKSIEEIDWALKEGGFSLRP